ncbi:hypothetical protein BXY58_2530 [Epilithonimonas arachidiradicis]|uniref:Uncharacterized protein n=1 Tax=Epilithonimonas arachidiradicis TaxID=1617282 RepID=A0A420D808_9FLAO|nr:hypothetical protein BXY58_2530 [Epilithonimonas arachidiradicis]
MWQKDNSDLSRNCLFAYNVTTYLNCHHFSDDFKKVVEKLTCHIKMTKKRSFRSMVENIFFIFFGATLSSSIARSFHFEKVAV